MPGGAWEKLDTGANGSGRRGSPLRATRIVSTAGEPPVRSVRRVGGTRHSRKGHFHPLDRTASTRRTSAVAGPDARCLRAGPDGNVSGHCGEPRVVSRERSVYPFVPAAREAGTHVMYWELRLWCSAPRAMPLRVPSAVGYEIDCVRTTLRATDSMCVARQCTG